MARPYHAGTGTRTDPDSSFDRQLINCRQRMGVVRRELRVDRFGTASSFFAQARYETSVYTCGYKPDNLQGRPSARA